MLNPSNRKTKLSTRIQWRHIRRAYTSLSPWLKAAPLKQAQPDPGTVLILSPHIDDEVIGSGGSIALHRQQGDAVHALYIADCDPKRQLEATRSAKILDYQICDFLPYFGKQWLAHTDAIKHSIASTIDTLQPASVYLPSFWDRSHDHTLLNHLLMQLHTEHRYSFTLYGMEIWSPIYPNLAIDITPVASIKQQALQQFVSQNASVTWHKAALYLNQYRGMTLHAGNYAECFMRYPIDDYYRIWSDMYSNEVLP